MVYVIKRLKNKEEFNASKIEIAIKKAFLSCNKEIDKKHFDEIMQRILSSIEILGQEEINIETIQDIIEETLMRFCYYDVAKSFILYREKHKNIREFADAKIQFINNYAKSDNTANATIDDNSNVRGKNIGILNAEIHKEDNLQISRRMIMNKLTELFQDFDSKNYKRDLESHLIYKNDENSFSGAISPYCCSISMYPFLLNGLKNIGGLSAAPKNLDSYCGMYINLIFATSAMFAGAVATSEFLLYFTYFCKKEWGDNFYLKPDIVISNDYSTRKKTIRSQIYQYWQQVVYSINQPAAARGLQSAFINFSYFDHPFFDGMFKNFYFPDGTQPDWDSLNWIQKEFMQWFNKERLKCILTFPVESFALVYKDDKFLDEENAKFVAEEYARGHSFFTYISDTVDSLSSCCRLKNVITTKEFTFTNGNLGIMTGSKSVITLNLSRIIQNAIREYAKEHGEDESKYRCWSNDSEEAIKDYLSDILERVYKYHIAYNESLWDMYNSNLLPVYKAGFIDLNKQYLTIGLNGLNQGAEYLGLKCNVNDDYQNYCQFIFGFIKEQNEKHKGEFNGHKIILNSELIPAESLAIKNYNWDKSDKYWTPNDTNLYASYIFKPNDANISVLDKFILHGKNYIGEYLDGGVALHCNLDSHLSKGQYWKLLNFAAENGCQYFTFNIPNSECDDCGYIIKVPIKECPKCGSKNISYYDRVIGYLTKIKNWSKGRQIEQKTRVYSKNIE